MEDKQEKAVDEQLVKSAEATDESHNSELEAMALKLRRRKIRMKKRLSLVGSILIFALVIIGLAIWGLLYLKPGDSTIHGQADCETVRVNGKLAGRLMEVYVKEGDYVHKGQRLAMIQSSIADARLAEAQARKDVAASQNEKVERGTRDELVQSAQKMVEQAQAAEEIYRKTYERVENLFNDGVVSEQRRDEAKAAYEAASATVAAAKSQLEMAQNGAQAEDIDASRGIERAAEATVKEVEAVLDDKYLVAPCDGVISGIYPRIGELVIMGLPLMTISNLDEMWVAFNVREDKLNGLVVGKEINVMIPALGNKEAKMSVFSVRDKGSFATWTATKAYGGHDNKKFEVKARPVNKIENFGPGMVVIMK